MVRKINLLLLLVLVIIVVRGDWKWRDLRYALEADPWGEASHLNRLALGERARGPKEVTIAITPMEEFDGWSKTELARRRRELVSRHENLVDGLYEPSRAVFGGIVSGKPWWGIIGQEYYLRDGKTRSTAGPSEESRQILNPFVLLWPSHWSFWLWDESTEVRTRVTEADLHSATFPLTLTPSSLTFYPYDRIARLRFPLTEFRARIDSLWERFPEEQWGVGGLNNYNARDLGLPFLMPVQEESKNINFKCRGEGPRVAEITEYVHLGGSCAQPGGCNNMSGSMGDTGCWMAVVSRPAELVYFLWSKYPQPGDPPELRFILEYF